MVTDDVIKVRTIELGCQKAEVLLTDSIAGSITTNSGLTDAQRQQRALSELFIGELQAIAEMILSDMTVEQIQHLINVERVMTLKGPMGQES